MPEIPDPTEILATLGPIGQVLLSVIGAYFVAFWFSLITWTSISGELSSITIPE